MRPVFFVPSQLPIIDIIVLLSEYEQSEVYSTEHVGSDGWRGVAGSMGSTPREGSSPLAEMERVKAGSTPAGADSRQPGRQPSEPTCDVERDEGRGVGPAVRVSTPDTNTHGQTGTCLQHGPQLCSGKGHAGISPQATSKAARKPNHKLARPSSRSYVPWAPPAGTVIRSVCKCGVVLRAGVVGPQGQVSSGYCEPCRAAYFAEDKRSDELQKRALSVVRANTSGGHTCPVLAGEEPGQAMESIASVPAPGPVHAAVQVNADLPEQGVTAGETARDADSIEGRGVDGHADSSIRSTSLWDRAELPQSTDPIDRSVEPTDQAGIKPGRPSMESTSHAEVRR